MDYETMAEELLMIHAKLNRAKFNEQMRGFTQGELYALGYLNENGKRAYPKDISKAMLVSSARVAVIINHLEKKGCVQRIADPSDSRKTVVVMTDAGEKMYSDKQREVIRSVVEALKKLGEHDAQELLRIRKKMIP
ncbi:MAG: MarR family transcriptional regulator [Clostridiales bacterium]|nr:MarR family transcriptional regulator [Clostridiales bacterium]